MTTVQRLAGAELRAQLTRGKEVYDVMDPSDAYTIRADDFLVAALAIGASFGGTCAIQSVMDPAKQSPILFGWREWFAEQGVPDCEQFADEHLEEMSGVLESIVIGSPGEREELESTIAMIDDADLVAWFDRRHDRRRSSCNDIGGRARAIAKQLREAVKRKQSAEISVSPPSSLRTTNHGQNDNRVV